MLTVPSISNARIPPSEIHLQFCSAQAQRLPNSINRYFNIVLERILKDSITKESKNLCKHKMCSLKVWMATTAHEGSELVRHQESRRHVSPDVIMYDHSGRTSKPAESPHKSKVRGVLQKKKNVLYCSNFERQISRNCLD